jgi:hypothetical protein
MAFSQNTRRNAVSSAPRDFQELNRSRSYHTASNPTSNSKLSHYIDISTPFSLKDTYIDRDGKKLLRKLGQNERIFHGQNNINRSYIYRSLLVITKVNFNQNVNIVLKAIDEWKKIHPLLRCRVLNMPDPKNELLKEGYFSYASDQKVKGFDNIRFLHYKSNNSSSNCEDIWKLLVEHETTMPLDGENGLLWRLKFFEIKNLSRSEKPLYLYAVILAFDHAIMDGRSSYKVLLQLFSLIEDIYMSKFKRPKEEPILPPKEDIFKTKRETVQPQNTPQFYLKAPSFLDIENAYKTAYIPLKNLSVEEETRGVIYTHENRPYVTVRELIRVSKCGNSKFRTLVINKTDLARLIKKCKENNVKLTSFLNMILVLALRLLYDNNKEHISDKDQIINYATNISLREFPEFKQYNTDNTNNSTIGCYIGLSFMSFTEQLRFSNSNKDWVNDFWRLTKKESDDFHTKLNKGEFVNSIHLPPIKKEKDDFFYHFGNSNLGKVDASLKKDEVSLIRVQQAFATSKYSRENFLCWFSNLIITVEDQLCWTISYNTYCIRQGVIDMIIENLTKVIRDLIE